MSQVAIRHPLTGGVAVQSREQFDALYAVRGWEIVTVDPALASRAVGVAINDLSELSSDQLVKVIAAHDAQKPSDRKADLIALHADELREQAKTLGLPAGGSKEDIADRIVAHEVEAARAAADAG